MAKKRFLKWIWEDVILAFAVAVGLDVVVKTQWPKLLSELSTMLGSTMKQKVDNDKRAEILREFRRMEVDTKININNLKRRYADSIQNRPIPEYLFVELLSKIPPTDPNDPLNTRPPVTPGISAAPQNDRQADLKWLNDMPDDQFYQMFEFLHHDVISQWWRIGRDWVVGILAGLGIAGIWMLGALRFIWHFAVHLFEWVSKSLWRIALVALVAAILFWPLTLIIFAIFAPLIWLHGYGAADQNGIQHQSRIGIFDFIGIMIGAALAIGMYFKLVPTSTDKELAHAVLMAIAAMFFFWNIRWVRISLFSLIAILTLIFFLGGRTAAKNELRKALAQGSSQSHQNNNVVGVILPSPSVLRDHSAVRTSNASAPLSNHNPAAAETDDGKGGEVSENSTPIMPPKAPPVEQNPIYYPLTGDKGILVPIIYDCYYSAGDVVTCEGSIQNNDEVGHGVYLMDSQGAVNTQTGGSQFSVWTFGGSIQFVGGTDFANVIPNMQSPFTFSFRENTGRAEYVGITLFLKSAADSLNHSYVFANIPVKDHRG